MLTYKFNVSGHGPFPIDMLRHDRATPNTESDSGLIERTYQPRVSRQRRTITMLSFLKPPTIDRWLSFGWSVHDIKQIKS